MRTSKPASRPAGGLDRVRPVDDPELRPDGDPGAPLCPQKVPVPALVQTSSPGQGTTQEKTIRSALCAYWTPAVFRFLRIICSNDWR